MSSEQWELFENIPESLNASDFPPGVIFAIAENIEEAISASSRLPLHELSIQLEELFNKLLRSAPIEAVNAIRRSTSASNAEIAAYTLGQISFAQLLTAQSYERRADDEFVPTLCDYRYKKYINALYQQEYTGVELAEKSSEDVATVSRKLKKLRELGITDFRREGNRISNFLTPATRIAVKALGLADDTVASSSPPALQKFMAQITSDLPDSLQSRPTFDIKDYGFKSKEAA